MACVARRALHFCAVPLALARRAPPPLATSAFARLVSTTLSAAAAPAPALPPAAEAATRYKGATQDKRSGRWRASITVNKKRIALGVYDTAKDASDAYLAARAVYTDATHGRRYREADSGVRESASTAAATAPAAAAARVGEGEEEGEASSPPAAPGGGGGGGAGGYLGVHALSAGATGAPSWEAVIVVGGEEVSGGEYESAAAAARAYDALARMYGGAGAATNFAAEAAEAWVPPTAAAAAAAAAAADLLAGGGGVARAPAIAELPGVPLTAAEVEAALRQERGLDVRVMALAGKSDLAEHMVWVTGRDARHMGRMADALSRALRRRALPGVDATVEARDMDDWMVVDAGNIIINIMDADARECFALEAMYEGMVEGAPAADDGLSYDAWLEANPIPQKWLDRLARDEAEMEVEQRARKGGPLRGGGASRGAAALLVPGEPPAARSRRRTTRSADAAPGGPKQTGPARHQQRRRV